MTNANPTDERPAQAPPQGASPLDAGPAYPLPTFRLALLVIGASAGVALIAWPLVQAISPDAAAGLPRLALTLAAAFLVALLAMRPWRPRATGRWMMAWLIHLGVAFLATLAAGGVLLYSAPSERRPAFGITLAAGHLVVLLAEALLVAAHVRASATPTPASPEAPSAPTNE